MYISRRGERLARMEPVTASRSPAYVRRFLRALTDSYGCAAGGTTSVKEFERMMVSAAKMWKFRPAFKDGHPVRYREKIRITL